MDPHAEKRIHKATEAYNQKQQNARKFAERQAQQDRSQEQNRVKQNERNLADATAAALSRIETNNNYSGVEMLFVGSRWQFPLRRTAIKKPGWLVWQRKMDRSYETMTDIHINSLYLLAEGGYYQHDYAEWRSGAHSQSTFPSISELAERDQPTVEAILEKLKQLGQ